MRQNPHVRICGGPGSATTLVYPTTTWPHYWLGWRCCRPRSRCCSVGDALDVMASGNLGLTFIWIPQLFAQIPGGGFVLPLFFVALSCAALPSLIAMIELATRVLMDGGMARAVAVRLVAVAAVVCGIPSAVSLAVFENQDWVWGLGVDDQRAVRRGRRDPIRSGPVSSGVDRSGAEPRTAGASVRLDDHVSDPGAFRRHVRLVDVSGGRRLRP